MAPQNAQRKASIGGRDSETWWSECHRACLDAGIAYVHKVQVPYRVVGMTREGQVIRHSEKTGSDFEGVLLDGTKRRIFAESKSSSDDVIRLGSTHGGLRPKQLERLRAVHEQGHVAIVLVRFRAVDRAFAIPWEHCEDGSLACRVRSLRGEWEVDAREPYLARWIATPVQPTTQRRIA